MKNSKDMFVDNDDYINIISKIDFLKQRGIIPQTFDAFTNKLGLILPDTSKVQLKEEIDTLKKAISDEANYSQQFADQYKGTDRGDRHLERAIRLRSYLNTRII